MTLFATSRVRCVSDDGRPGSWQSPPHAAFEAMREAVRMAHGKSLDGSPAAVWGPVTAEWRRLRDAGWSLESEDAYRRRVH